MKTKNTLRKSTLSGLLLLGAITILFTAVPQASAAEVFVGQWNNKKYKTKGTMTATLTKGQGNNWSGVFTGVAIGKNYRFTARFTEKTSSGKRMLVGNSNIDGSMYKWAAYIGARTLNGTYRAANGNNGNFSGRKR